MDGEFSGFNGSDDLWSLSVTSSGSAYHNTWDSSMLSFTDLFSDRVINLGVFGYGSSLDVTFQWRTNDAASSFNGKFAAGFSAVPEPSSALYVIGVGLAIMGIRRRR
jgi:hypothetical protein